MFRGTAERDARVQRTGRLAKVAGDTGDVGPRKAPLGARANRRWLLSWPLVTHTPPNPHIALRRAPPYVDITERETPAASLAL